MEKVYRHSTGKVRVTPAGQSHWRVEVEPSDPGVYVFRRSCRTRYPPELVGAVFERKGVSWVCYEILRDEDPDFVQMDLTASLLGYRPPEAFERSRVLDFGCGAGASTSILARRFPSARILGIDLEEAELEVARQRAAFYGLENVEFMVSAGPASLPPGIGPFDFVNFSAVYEHLLPDERRVLLPAVWELLPSGGVLFVNQTPNRHFPLERHSTGLPLINYLPDGMAFWLARKWARLGREENWEGMLRGGVRGGTVGEIMHLLPAGDSGRPALLEPGYRGYRDRIDLWYDQYRARGSPLVMRAAWLLLKAVHRATGVVMTHSLSLAVEKRA
jgi:2-polyprenyl-3-methyl-5-hydroxy-6-metoxy-1,4-benzoquinol methylase